MAEEHLHSKNNSSVKIAAPLVVVAIFLGLCGLYFIKAADKDANHGGLPQAVRELIWAFDAGVHRILTVDEFGGDDAYEVERSKLTNIMERLKPLSQTLDQGSRESLDAMARATSGLLSSLEKGDRDEAIEQAAQFRETVDRLERSVTSAQEENGEPRSKAGAFILLILSGLLMFGACVFVLRHEQLALQQAASQLPEASSNANEILVARENEIATLRGQLDELTTARDEIQAEMETIKSDWQRQRIANSALEAKIQQLQTALGR